MRKNWKIKKEMKNTMGTIRKNRRKKRASDLLLLAALAVTLFAAGKIIGIMSEYRAGEKEYDNFMQYVVQKDRKPDTTATVSDPGALASETLPEAPISVDFSALQQVNEDIVGWIYAEAIPEISYPVVQGEDNDYYLHHTAEKKKNFSASIFLDSRNSADFLDPVSVVYGHNMKNRSMFGRLKEYRKQETYDKSPYIWILTPNGDYRYEIFSVHTVRDDDAVYELAYTQGEELKAYMDNMQAQSEVECSAAFTGNEPVLMLSTCTASDRIRCVVQAVRNE